jgi:hypothetical protein
VAFLERFLRLRWNGAYSGDYNHGIQHSTKLKALESRWPKVYASLRNIVVFTHKRQGSLNSGDSSRYLYGHNVSD